MSRTLSIVVSLLLDSENDSFGVTLNAAFSTDPRLPEFSGPKALDDFVRQFINLTKLLS